MVFSPRALNREEEGNGATKHIGPVCSGQQEAALSTHTSSRAKSAGEGGWPVTLTGPKRDPKIRQGAAVKQQQLRAGWTGCAQAQPPFPPVLGWTRRRVWGEWSSALTTAPVAATEDSPGIWRSDPGSSIATTWEDTSNYSSRALTSVAQVKGLQFSFWSGALKRGNWLMFLSHIDVSLPFSVPSPLSKSI